MTARPYDIACPRCGAVAGRACLPFAWSGGVHLERLRAAGGERRVDEIEHERKVRRERARQGAR